MPEVQFWQNIYQTSEVPPWDLEKPCPPLMELIEELKLLPPLGILVPGCGRGHDAIALAQRGHRIIGVDFAPAALAAARNAAAERQVDVTWESHDVMKLPQDWAGRFDLVAEHTCYAALNPGERNHYIAEMLRVLKPGGRLAGVFFNWDMDEDADPLPGPPFPSTAASIERRMLAAGLRKASLAVSAHRHRVQNREQIVAVFTKPGGRGG